MADDESAVPEVGPHHPERRIAVAYAPPAARAGLATLFAIDERLGGMTVKAREPAIGLMRLTWWRDALAALDDASPPGEPLLEAAAGLVADGVTGAELSRLAEGWEVVLDDPEMRPESIARHATMRGATLFRLAGRLLKADDARLAAAGEGWALADLARLMPENSALLLEHAAGPLDQALAARWPRALRSLGMLAVLARDDVRSGPAGLEPPAMRRRLLRMVAHRWTGR